MLWNSKVQYRIHKIPRTCPVPSQIKPSYFLKMYFNIILPSTPRSSRYYSIRFPYQIPVCTCPVRATCSAHFIRLDVITRIISGDGYKSQSSLLCSFLHCPVTSSFLGPNIFLSTPFSKTLSLCSSLSARKCFASIKSKKQNITVLYILIFVFFYSELET